MQDMNPFILPTPAPPGYVADITDPSPTSSATSRSYSWSMESDQQLYANDAAFWQDVSTFICSSPQNSFDYRPEDFACSGTTPTSPDEQNFKASEIDNSGSTQPRARGQTLELLLKRRAQNRASQRAYRDRRDQHVRDLELQYDAMVKRNAELERLNETWGAEYEKLKAEKEAWKVEREQLTRRKEEKGSKVVVREMRSGEEGEQADEEALLMRDGAQACLGRMLSAGLLGGMGEGGGGDGTESAGGMEGLVVKIVVCKRCFGNQIKAKCEE